MEETTVPIPRWKKMLLPLGIGAVVLVAAIILERLFSGMLYGIETGVVFPHHQQEFTQLPLTIYSTQEMNQTALAQSLRVNGELRSAESVIPESFMNSGFSYQIQLSLSDGDTVTLDPNSYNNLRSQVEDREALVKPEVSGVTTFKSLDQSPTWIFREQEVFIESVNQTENSQLNNPEYRLTLNGNTISGSENLHVFSVGIPTEMPVSQEDNNYWYGDCLYGSFERNNLDWSQFRIRNIDISEQNKEGITFTVDADWGAENSCFFVSLQEDADSLQVFAESKITPSEASLSLKELFNPDLEFKTVIEVDFKSPFFDTQKVRKGDDLIQYRTLQKERLALLFSVSPSADIVAEEIVLYSDRAEVPINLKDKLSYQVTLGSGTDVYGQSFSEKSLLVETGELTYLGFKQQESQTIFMDTALPTIDIVHYEVENPTVKLCRVALEEYAKIEQVVSRRNDYDFSDQFLLEGIDQLPVEECFNQEITLNSDSVRTPVDISKMIGSPGRSGLYFLTFAFQGERKLAEKAPVISPLFFSIVDAHISMKLSESGKALFWVNDIQTGEGIAGLTLKAYHNEFTASESRWNSSTRQTDYTYFSPLEKPVYKSLGEIGKTDDQGFLQADFSNDDYLEAFQSWYDAPEHNSLAITASNDNHLTYVVSKWNSGIAGWNFGFEPQSWGTGSRYSAHLFTDRKLYKPSETVHFKAIVRENADQLRIPQSKDFELILRDANYETLFQKTIQLNEFGSYLEDIELAENAALGIYRLELRGEDDMGMEYVMGGEFSVEEFKKPTFKVEVSVESPDLENSLFVDPKITQEKTRWGYSYKTYKKDLKLKADVMASYYAGGLVPDAPYHYQVFKQYYYDSSYWDDCYYGCWYEPSKDYVTEGRGTLDASGKASIQIPITHETRWSDYRYIVEVAVDDPSSQRVASSGSVIAKIPKSLRQYNPSNKVELEVDKQFVPQGEAITLSIKPEMKWREANDDQYLVALTHRKYSTKHQKQVGGKIVPQLDFEDEEVETIVVNLKNFSEENGLLTHPFTLPKDGEYSLSIRNNEGDSESDIQILKVYAYDPGGITNAPVVADNKIKVVTEKVSYHLGDKARLFVRLPFADGKALITIEKKEVVRKEVVDIKGNTLIKEYTVDDSFMPNAYISVIAFKPSFDSEVQPEYRVGYTEVVVDKTDKKLNITASSDQNEYAPRDKVTLSFQARDKRGNPVRSELSVAVVDEALIAIMGNIDLDILPKFFRKIVFQTHTALTNVAMLKHLYFARKGIIGGSGAKEGGDSIMTRTDFKNTAFYAGSVVTDSNGKATLSFDLPDNIGDFRVITIGHSKSNFFGAVEESVRVRQDIVVEETFPLMVRAGDEMRVGATVFNNSEESKEIAVSLDSAGLSTPDNSRQTITIPAGEREFITWRVKVADEYLSEVQYTITAAHGASGGDRIQKTVPVAKSPLISNQLHVQDDFQVSSNIPLTFIDDVDREQSLVELRLSNTLLIGVEKTMHSLLVYPYGCIEQTISSTLPNAIVKKFNTLLDIGISQSTLEKNLSAGIERFQKMQTDDGGFAYWPGGRESDAHVTPYVVLALIQMQELGVDIPSDILLKAQSFIENQVNGLSGNIPEDRLSQLVHELHALSKIETPIFSSAHMLLKNRVDQLSTHEKIVYALALSKKSVTNHQQEISDLIRSIDLDKAGDSKRNWYWNRTADKALFAQLLLLTNERQDEMKVIIKDLYALDLTSYYHSTQAKIQSFIAFTQYIDAGIENSTKSQAVVSYQLGSKTGTVRLSDRNPFQKISFPLSEAGSSNQLKLQLEVKGDTSQRIYSDLVIAQIPKNPSTITAQQDKGVTVSRQYHQLGMVKEEEGDWWTREARDLAPISGTTFTLGETYLVKVKVSYDDQHRELALESFLPAGFRLLNPRFKTDQAQVGEDQWSWPYNYRERRADRFFASARYGYDTDQEVTYYVRAEIPGTFLEPPVSVYPMYRPEIEAHTEFRKVTIKE
ncbi:MAG: MG2 domain-containing protein [Candidatus Gracilibacteria bacterium]|nr:MG2 domain-containing protein [Candidatus Gracilibacteria bacterium]